MRWTSLLIWMEGMRPTRTTYACTSLLRFLSCCFTSFFLFFSCLYKPSYLAYTYMYHTIPLHRRYLTYYIAEWFRGTRWTRVGEEDHDGCGQELRALEGAGKIADRGCRLLSLFSGFYTSLHVLHFWAKHARPPQLTDLYLFPFCVHFVQRV